MNFKEKVVIVTGAGSGIGAATAKLFASHGAKVVVSDIHEANAISTKKEITTSSGISHAIVADVTSITEVENLINKTIEKYGALDIMINNAGIGNKYLAKTAEHTLEDWENVIAVNQTGVFYCMKLALQHMIRQGHGNIVNVASLAGLKASGNNLAYTASKFAVVGMTKSAALEYASKNIRINAVCPGYTRSPLFDRIIEEKPEMHDKLLRYVPMKRFGRAEEVADAILWLASDQTSFITGQTITIDGGLSL